MGLLSEEFKKEEKKFVEDLTKSGISFEEISKIRIKYEHNFNGKRETFEKFKNEVRKTIVKPKH